jgi:nicotinate-nucleotide pyrophosphorylase (carboxylating)
MDLDRDIERLIETSINEDIRSGDITTSACIDSASPLQAKLVLKQAGVIAGLPFFSKLLQKINPKISVEPHVADGSYQKAGTLLATITGPAASILSGDRIALNFIQHPSGIATLTHAYVQKVAGFGCAILDTRKNLPGLRSLEKYAVRMGGGLNHRFGLDDRFIIKASHLAFLAKSHPRPVLEAARRVSSYRSDVSIEIEIDRIDYLDDALNTSANVLILCNMTPDEVSKCVKKARLLSSKKVYVDPSNIITIDTVRAYAETGVEAILIGAITHSVPALDIGIKM